MEIKPDRGPFCLEWKIGNLAHWSVDVHGHTLETIVDFDHGRRVDFRICKGAASRALLIFPRKLRRYHGTLIIRGSDGRVFCSLEKKTAVKNLKFEHSREQLGDHFVLFISLENACVNLRCEYATTVLQPVPTGSQFDPREHYVVETASCRRTFRRRLDQLYSSREPQTIRQLIPSLEGLSIGQDSPRQNQPSSNDLPSGVHRSMDRDLVDYMFRRRLRQLWSIMVRPTNLSLPTSNQTPEQLIPSLGSLSISQEVESSSSDQSASTNIGNMSFPIGTLPSEMSMIHLRPPSTNTFYESSRSSRRSRYCPYLSPWPQ